MTDGSGSVLVIIPNKKSTAMLFCFWKVLHPDLIIDLPDPKVSVPVDN